MPARDPRQDIRLPEDGGQTTGSSSLSVMARRRLRARRLEDFNSQIDGGLFDGVDNLEHGRARHPSHSCQV